MFTEALIAEASNKLFVQNNLRRALEQNELLVHYQPKVCLKRAKLLGLEALIRWQHPEKGMIRPDQFISIAEETGLIVPIGKWVIREVCRQLHRLDAAGFDDLQIAINLSPKQFTDPDLVQSFVTILDEEGIAPKRLELELTESLLLDATDATRNTLEALKRLGMSLAMDDFGTGYSSLSYLKKFPIDVIKIDRSFIKDIPDNQDDMEITSAVTPWPTTCGCRWLPRASRRPNSWLSCATIAAISARAICSTSPSRPISSTPPWRVTCRRADPPRGLDPAAAILRTLSFSPGPFPRGIPWSCVPKS